MHNTLAVDLMLVDCAVRCAYPLVACEIPCSSSLTLTKEESDDAHKADANRRLTLLALTTMHMHSTRLLERFGLRVIRVDSRPSVSLVVTVEHLLVESSIQH